LRITCPGDAGDQRRLSFALETVLAPEAVLFDMDGVLADVSRSYRAAILETARAFGVTVGPDAVSGAKRAGNANDDWALTRELLAQNGVEESLAEVTQHFERVYQGTEERPGLRRRETLTVDRVWLERLRARVRLGVVTGRPRADALRFLDEQGIAELFDVVVGREDGPLRPDPAPLFEALRRLGLERAWYVGDTVDDVRAARAAGLLPVGVIAPGESGEETRPVLLLAGASRVIDRLNELEDLLP